jgi:hypothetical protein
VAFEIAVYTDVVASEAIDGVDGFNFQAVSAGLTAVDQQRIRESLLHRVVPAWALEHDELSHPATCAYVVRAGRSYLSRGKSTGTTNSGRPGNQLTQAIVTSDPDDFVPYRPAQLFGALEWTLERAPTSQVEPWVTPLEIRPEFEVTSLEEFVSGDEWASSVLPHFLTMLDGALAPEPKKLVLLHTDVDVVMRWIALGTLFVDAEAARMLQFRALVDDPWRADAALVGVSPDFGSGEFSSANVLDLTQRDMPSIVPSDVARLRAAWFLQQGADDALNAIEIARRWEPALGSQLAHDAARIVALPEDASERGSRWRTAMSVVERLASAGLRDDLALYAEELCEATLSYGPTSDDEFRLAGRAIRRAHDLGVEEVASGVAVPTLEALAAIPAVSQGFAKELSGVEVSIRWDSADAQEAAGAFLGEVMAGAPTSALPEVFAAARVIGAAVPESTLTPAAANLSALWLRDPRLGRDTWQGWIAGNTVVSATARRALNAFRVGDEKALVDLLRGEWDFLAAVVDDPALEGWLKAGQLARSPVEDRQDQIALTTRIPSDAWRVLLAGSTLPRDAALWASWITHHGLPDDLATVVRSALEATLGAHQSDLRHVEVGDWGPLMKSLSGTTDRELSHLARNYARARTAFRGTRDDVRTRSGARLDSCIQFASSLAPLFLADIGWLLLNATNREEVERLMDAAAPWGQEAVRASILNMATTGHGLGAIDHALRARSHPNKDLAAAAEDALAQVLESQPDLALPRNQSRLRTDMEKYLRHHSKAQRPKRRLGGPFGRGKEN